MKMCKQQHQDRLVLIEQHSYGTVFNNFKSFYIGKYLLLVYIEIYSSVTLLAEGISNCSFIKYLL